MGTTGNSSWKEFQPKRYAELKRTGKLQEEAEAAAGLTQKGLQELMDQGSTYHEAWEQVRERYLFPPEEKQKETEELPTAASYNLMKEILEEGARIANLDE